MQMWWVGTATLVLEIGPIRILTDPALGRAPARYAAGFGLHYERTADPHPPEDLGHIDAVLLSHDEHGDNLDEAGRALLPSAGVVLTTEAGAERLGGNARGLAPYASAEIVRDGFSVTVTATPARHGPPGSLPLVGRAIGFVLEWAGQSSGALYVSGDTVYTRAVAAIAQRWDIGTAILHTGAAGFPILGHVTLDRRDTVKLARALDPEVIVPVHNGSWSHFHDTAEETIGALDEAGFGDRVVRPVAGWISLPE
ncbi:MAG: MBL fold metallo-hydrolase [Myxococcota bacterium]